VSVLTKWEGEIQGKAKKKKRNEKCGGFHVMKSIK
jgi:hypothetical protein